jgi:hypothetical protein
LALFGSLPIVGQLNAVEIPPFEYVRERARRKLPGHHAIGDANNDFTAAVPA